MLNSRSRFGGSNPRARLRAMTLLGAGVIAAATALPAPAAASAGTSTVATHQQAASAADQQAVLDYWTPERVKALTQPSSANPPKAGPDGAPWTTPNALPRTTGRLFFTDHGEDASCTATVVDSANRSTVVTAGHCVNSTDLLGEDDQWTTNVLFIPGYHDGQAPFGKFVGRTGVADVTWLQDDAQNAQKFDAYDQAFDVLNTNAKGQRVQDAVGVAQKVGFDRPGAVKTYQFGYPRAAQDPAREGLPEYTGERLAFCTGLAKEYPGTPDYPDSKGQFGPACVMGGGSSGGPRIADFNPYTGLGTVVGDITHAGFFDGSGKVCTTDDNAGCTRYLVGPQFTSAITKPLYEWAQHLN